MIRDTSVGISERYSIEVEGLGMDSDHIHLLCSAHPKVSAGEIVRIFKSITAREIFKQVPEVKKVYQHVKYSRFIQKLKRCFGVVNFGQMDIMLGQ